jgi:hypothetical protein
MLERASWRGQVCLAACGLLPAPDPDWPGLLTRLACLTAPFACRDEVLQDNLHVLVLVAISD